MATNPAEQLAASAGWTGVSADAPVLASKITAPGARGWAVRACALAGSTVGAIRDGVPAGGITPLRPGGSSHDCED